MDNTNIQAERIDVLNETIAIMNRRILSKDEHRQHLNETIERQSSQLEAALKTISTQAIEIGDLGEQIEIQNKHIKTLIEVQNHTDKQQKEMIKNLSSKLNTIKL